MIGRVWYAILSHNAHAHIVLPWWDHVTEDILARARRRTVAKYVRTITNIDNIDYVVYIIYGTKQRSSIECSRLEASTRIDG
jgi:hypothetical protein